MCCVGNTARTTAPHPLTRPSAGMQLLLVRVVLCAFVALPASGCALSFPLAGFTTDQTATGSIGRSDALLFKALDQEDWRRAKAAMAVALDPQGNGASVAWDNPTSGAHGRFVAIANPVARADAVCRDFKASMVPAASSDREVVGSACRDPGGDWTVRQASERNAPS